MDAYKIILNIVSLSFMLWTYFKCLLYHAWHFKDYLISYLWTCVYALMPKKRRYVLDKNHVPKHLGLLLTEDDDVDVIADEDQSRRSAYASTLNTLADIFADCCRYGVQTVTVYDPYGRVTRSRDVERLCTATESRVRGKSSFVLSVNGNLSRKGESSKITNRSIIDIRLIDYRSGRHSLVNVARKLITEKSLEKIDTKIVDQRLADDQLLTNIDYVLKFGSIDSVLGFPPLCLPITEFLYLPSIKNFDELALVECLEKFANRDRRHGK